MIEISMKKDCCGCEACAQICPKGCIWLQSDEEGFCYPVVDAAVCVECGLCEKTCPILQREKADTQETMAVFAAFGKDETIREHSSSGGIFSLLAQWVLAQGGVVFGAAFAENFSVHHVRIDTPDDLGKLRGSKYVQSRTENTYREAKLALKQGRKVLYSGVGCQIAGLKAFLQKEYPNLYTVDVICHGVPSPKVWTYYLSDMTKCQISRIGEMSLRDKKNGWHAFATAIRFLDGKEYLAHHDKDNFMRLFLCNICLRPSCHNCYFRKGKSGADITLGDAWGIEKWMPEMDDDRGTSVVFVNSAKGQLLWDAIQMHTIARQADAATVVKYNSAYEKSVKPHPNRTRFFREMNRGASIEELVRLTRQPLWRRCASFGKRVIKKILSQ